LQSLPLLRVNVDRTCYIARHVPDLEPRTLCLHETFNDVLETTLSKYNEHILEIRVKGFTQLLHSYNLLHLPLYDTHV
jgi:hypothetical protein